MAGSYQGQYLANEPNLNDGDFHLARVDRHGRQLVSYEFPESHVSTFGELVTAQLEPSIQLDAIHGLTTDVETFSATGGSATVVSRMFKCTTGGSVGGYGTIRSKRQQSYSPGQASRFMFTARFSEGIPLCYLFAGAFDAENALGFGYVGSDYGIIRQTDGRLEIRTLTITNPAGGAETVTITLNSIAYTASVTSGTAAQNAAEIAADSEFGSSTAWNAYATGSTVVFVATSTGVRSGTYSISSIGALTGTYVQNQIGTANARTLIAQTDWNGNHFNWTLDPSKLNIYRIDFGYLGAADISFWVASPQGKWVLAHRIEYPNSYEIPNIHDPYLNIGWVAASLGSATNLICEGASACAGTLGAHPPRRNSRGFSADKTAISTTFLPIASTRIRAVMANDVNKREIVIDSIDVAFEHSKTGRVEVLLNPTLTGARWTYIDETNSCVEYDTSATAVSGGTVLAAAALPKSGSVSVSLPYANRYERTDVICVAVRALSGTGGEASMAIVWSEV